MFGNSFAKVDAPPLAPRGLGAGVVRGPFSFFVPLVLASGVTSGGHIPGRDGRGALFSIYSNIPFLNPRSDINFTLLPIAPGYPPATRLDTWISTNPEILVPGRECGRVRRISP